MSGEGARTGRRVAVAVVVVLAVGMASFAVARATGGDDEAAGEDTSGGGAGLTAGGAVDVPTEEVPVLAPISVAGEVGDLALLGAEGAGPDDAEAVAPDGDVAMSGALGVIDVPTAAAVDQGIAPLMTSAYGVPPAEVAPPGADGAEDAPEGGEVVRTDIDPVEVLGGAPDGEGGVPGFVDPCAGAEPGADPAAEGCPTDGEGGTVIESFAIEGVPPLWVVGYPWPAPEAPDEGFIAQCPPQEVGEGEVPFGITVGNPATVTLSWWSDRDPTVRREELRTTAAQQADWDAWRDDGMPYRWPYDMPRLCTSLTDLQVGDTVHFQIIAVDDADQIASAADTMVQTHFTWRAPAEDDEEGPAPAPDIARVRPPTRLWALADNELAVIAPVQEGQEVTVLAYPRVSMSDVDPCEVRSMTDHPGYAQPIHQRLRKTSEIPESVRSAPDYEWDPTYTGTLWDGMRLPSGANVRLCVLRNRVDGPSFDRGYEEVEAFEVSVPELQGFELTLDDVASREAIAEGDLIIRARPVQPRGILNNPTCWVSRWRSPDLPSGTSTIDEPLCGAGDRWRDGFRLGIVVDVEFADPQQDEGAEPLTSSMVIPLDLDCDGSCRPREPETYRLELPTVSRANGLCSPGIFQSTCEPPRADVVLGSATLTVTYTDDGVSGTDQWWVGASESLGDQRVEPEGPQLDRGSPGSQGGTIDDPTWTQELHLDRPATAEVELIPIEVPGEEPFVCLHDDAVTAVRSDELATDHTVTFTGLCPNGAYGMLVRLTDADGDQTLWGPVGTEGVSPWRGAYFTTEPIELAVTGTIEIGPLPSPGDGGYIHTAETFVGGNYLRWLNELTGCRSDWRRINSNPSTAWAGDTVHVQAVLEASGVRGTDGCWFEHRDGTPAWEGGRTVLRADIPVDEAVAADEVVLSSGPDDPIPLTVTLHFRRRR